MLKRIVIIYNTMKLESSYFILNPRETKFKMFFSQFCLNLLGFK